MGRKEIKALSSRLDEDILSTIRNDPVIPEKYRFRNAVQCCSDEWIYCPKAVNEFIVEVESIIESIKNGGEVNA